MGGYREKSMRKTIKKFERAEKTSFFTFQGQGQI